MAKRNGKESALPTFEQLMADTEALAERLESGELPLEEAMAQYETGVKNLKLCAGMIEEAQKKIKTLVQNTKGEPELADFEDEEADEDGDDNNKDEG